MASLVTIDDLPCGLAGAVASAEGLKKKKEKKVCGISVHILPHLLVDKSSS